MTVADVPSMRRRPGRLSALALATALAAAALAVALVALRHRTALTAMVPLARGAPRILEVDADRANIRIEINDAPPSQFKVAGELRAFGVLNGPLGARIETSSPPAPVLRYSLEAHGWPTDVTGSVMLSVPATAFERLRVWVRYGDIEVVDASRAGVMGSGSVELQLTTGDGVVRRRTRPPD